MRQPHITNWRIRRWAHVTAWGAAAAVGLFSGIFTTWSWAKGQGSNWSGISLRVVGPRYHISYEGGQLVLRGAPRSLSVATHADLAVLKSLSNDDIHTELRFVLKQNDQYAEGRYIPNAGWRYVPRILVGGVYPPNPAAQVCERLGKDAVVPSLLELLEDPRSFAAAHFVLLQLHGKHLATATFSNEGDGLVVNAQGLKMTLEDFGLPSPNEDAPREHLVYFRRQGRRSFNVSQLPDIRRRWHEQLDNKLFAVPPGILLAGSVIVFAISFQRMVTSWRLVRLPHMCPVCGYDLRATPERCPECGAVADQ